MLSVFARGMLALSNQARACLMRLRTLLLTTKQPQQLSHPDLTDDMRQACSMLSVFSRGMLLQSEPGAHMLNAPTDAAAHNQATASAFGPGSR